MTLKTTTHQTLAQLYGTDVVRIRQNHHENKSRFVEGVHFYKVVGDELHALKHKVALNYFVKSAPNARHLILWTERGAARHAKMLETDQAWDVFEKLEDGYFNQREKVANHPQPVPQPESSLDRARAMEIALNVADRLVNMFLNLSSESKQAAVAGVFNPIVGRDVVPLPAISEHYYSATEVGQRYGISANKVGRIANTYMLKTEKYGKWFIDKSAHNDKQVETFRYNEAGVHKIEELIEGERKAA
ncbi:ORF6N domain-containing protein [Shigella flexneri]|uniref:ORF6N domain-containing protein n=1 Tax=Shigella flexneri TaxID=623 RepID=UPI002716C714|nr:ORF6N domain-containing protein [Shigella flexneri]MDO8244232.1 ORF6N domain-containing protein [Shigella flexneri]